jgi:cell division topological specificity factor
MIAAIKRLFSSGGESRESKNVAKSRLSFVLVQDRTGLTQEEIAGFKKEMVQVIEKYFVIDETGLDVSYKRETDSTMLIINSPVVVKRQLGFKSKVGAKARETASTSNTKEKTANTETTQEAVGS